MMPVNAKLLYEGQETLLYKGKDQASGCPVVFKILKEKHPSPDAVLALDNEYDLTKGLPVGLTRRALAREVIDGKEGLSLEYVKGETVSAYFRKAERSLDEFLTVGIAICKALESLHRQNIVHKNISGENILIEEKTRDVRIIDFGLAARLMPHSRMFANREKLEGTLTHMAPEQTGRVNRPLDYRADLYSLGVTFYDMLTGEVPFTGGDPLELVHSHLARVPVPPTEKRPELPGQISAIVMRMLEKSAADRYQSAHGVRHDLTICVDHLKENGHIESFPLGAEDYPGYLLFSQKLYGRAQDIARLYDTFDRVATGGSELQLLAGYAGVGKTALVRELRFPVIERGGLFVEGKFDQIQRNVPYSAWIHALSDLVGQFLTLGAKELAAWNASIRQALGGGGKVLTDIIPNLELVIGEQPPVPELGGIEAQNRFNYVFQNFIKAVAGPDHPVVFFFDDLQWIDEASLNLLLSSLANPDLNHVLFIGAYRDNEVGPSHPLLIGLESLQRDKIREERLVLANLTLEDVNALISDTLHCSPPDSMPLAELVYSKTAGNAFFTHQMLSSLVEQGLLTFDVEKHRWVWDMETLRVVDISDNVVEFMVNAIQKLPASVQDTLKMASCIGNQFDVVTLAIVAGKSENTGYGDLQVALQEGFLFHVKDLYKFSHDRIQQAAYSLIAEPDRKAVHWRIGILLMRNIPHEECEERIFDIVSHLNKGAVGQRETGEDRTKLVELNLKAGKRAKATTAYGAALDHFETGLAFLDESGWAKRYPLSLSIHQEALEAAYLCGHYSRMAELAAVVHQQAMTLVDEIPAYEIEIKALTTQGRLLQGAHLGLEVLARLGLKIPKEPTPEETGAQFMKTVASLEQCRIENIASLPVMTAPERLACMRILGAIGGPIYAAAPQLLVYWASVIAEYSLTHGNSFWSPFAYAAFALILNASNTYIDMSYRLGKLTIDLLEPLKAGAAKCQILDIYGCHIIASKEHIRNSIPVMEEGIASATETGDFTFGGFNACNVSVYAYYLGEPLGILLQRIMKNRHLITQFRQTFIREWLDFLLLAVLKLNDDLTELNKIDSLSEEASLAAVHQAGDKTALAYYYLHKLIVAYLLEDNAGVLAHATEAKRYNEGIQGTFGVPLFYFYDSLARLRFCVGETDLDRPDLLTEARENQRKLEGMARLAPMNFQHKYDLVAAEIARVEGDYWKAARLYDMAIEEARENHFIQELALIYELAAKFYLGHDMDEIAQLYMNKAYDYYGRWQATAKLRRLEEVYRHWFSKKAAPADGADAFPAGGLDVSSVMKAAQAISGEIDLGQLLNSLMRIVVENAGAQRAFLILEQAGEWVVAARGDIQNRHLDYLKSGTLEENDEISAGIVHYVIRTHENVILNDAALEGKFTLDAAIMKRKPKSVLCVPLMMRGSLKGAIYLENNLAVAAFTPARVRTLEILAAQAAISLENALYYETLKQLNVSLEQEIAERKRTEEERQKLEDQLLQSQKMEAIGTLASGVAHDFNNLLAAIIGYSEIALEQEQDEARQKSFKEIFKASERAKNLVKQILTFSRHSHPEIKPVDIRVIMTEFLDFARASIPTTVEIHHQMTPEPCIIMMDPTQIHQVLMNICNNAAYAMKEAGGVLSIDLARVEIEAGDTLQHYDLSKGSYVKIAINDTGSGIDPAYLHRIYDPFFTTKSSGEGTGLGLSVVYGIIKNHGGVINVYSDPGIGTTFNIYLPRVEGQDIPQAAVRADISRGTERILFVDDESVLVEMFAIMLEASGYAVTPATSSAEALELFSSNPDAFDLVITDMTMPKMTGIELSRQLLKIKPTVPIILCSGIKDGETEARVKALGIRAYCLKPLTKKELTDTIRSVLEARP